jgi:hypothetical protein
LQYFGGFEEESLRWNVDVQILSQKVAASGFDIIDAPVSGGGEKAEKGIIIKGYALSTITTYSRNSRRI